MKNIIFTTLTLLVLCFQLNAQTGGAIWVGSNSSNANANAVHAFIAATYDAFISGNYEKGWAGYADECAEIDPAGNVTFGKKTLREGFDAFLKMADEAPKFKYSNVQVRMLTGDIALAVWDSEADIKIGGQQMGGKTKGMAVVRKVEGQWKLEFDSVTPVLPMPEMPAPKGN